MVPNLTSGAFKIVSLIEGNPPIGVKPAHSNLQFIHLNGVHTTCEVREEAPHIYRLGLGRYPFTGVVDNKVAALIHPGQDLEWRAIYREHQDAYTIEPIYKKDYGWTVAEDSEVHSQIVIKRIEVFRVGMHPRFLHSQLYRFVRVHE